MQDNKNINIKDKELEIAKIISNITDISLDKLIYSIHTFGIEEVLNKTEIVTPEKEEQQKLTDLLQIIKLGGDANESI